MNQIPTQAYKLVEEEKYKLMRNMKKPLYFFLLIVFFSILNLNSMELTINAIEINYSTDDDIILNIKLFNDSNYRVLIPLVFIPEDYYIEFEILNEEGISARFIGSELDYIQSDIDLVRMPEQSHFIIPINITKFYLMNKGIYSIIAIYSVSKHSYMQKDLWIGKLFSNEIQVVVK